MKAAVLLEKGDIQYMEVPEPCVQAGMVKIKVAACGICGSDIPRVWGDAAHSFPIILGHEFSGLVVEVGEGVASVKVGDHVVGAPLIPCHRCSDCMAGNYSLCKQYSFLGSRQQGAFAEYVVIPEINALKISKEIPFIQAAAFEPSTVALHALRVAGFKCGSTVAVLGCGIIGLFAIQWARILGASRVVAIGRGREGLNNAAELGADEVYSTSDENWKENVMTATDRRGFDFVFEAAGTVDAMHHTFQISANKSTICFIGTPKEAICFTIKEWELINRKEMFITGSWMSYSAPFPGSEWADTASFFADGKLRFISGMIYKTFELSRCKNAFNLFKQPGQVKGRVILVNHHLGS